MKYWFSLIEQNLGKRLYIGIFWSFVTVLSGIALLMLSGWFITATALTGISLAAGIALMFDMYMPGSGIRFFALSRTISRYVERIYNHDSILRLISVFRLSLFTSLSGLNTHQLRATNDSEWLGKLTADLDALDGILLRYTLPPIVAMLMVLSLSVFISFFWFEFALAMAAFMLLCLLASIQATIKFTRYYAHESTRLLNSTRSDVIEHLQGAYELHAYKLMKSHEDTLQARMSCFYAMQTGLQQRLANIQLVLDISLGLASIALVCVGLYAVNNQLISGPVAVMLVLMFMGASELLQTLPAQFSTWGKTEFSASRLQELAQITAPESGSKINLVNTLDVEIKQHPQIGYTQQHAIAFRLKKGHIVNVIGRSGAGKSSVAKLIIGEHKQQFAGSVRINNSTCLSKISDTAWYTHIAYLEQANTVLAGSLAYNLALGIADITEEEVWRVLEIVELKQWANTLPEGLNTWLGETGGEVSGGQARRICLARLLLRQPALIILDEPFNGIDEHMAKRIWQNMQPWLSASMVLLLSHQSAQYLHNSEKLEEISIQTQSE